MPTTNKTTNTASFDPNSMNAYQGGISSGMGVLQQDVANPQKQIGFNQRIAQGNSQLFNSFQRNNASTAQRAGAFGGTTPGFMQNQMAQNQRSLSSGQANLFNQNLMYADQVKQSAASQMMNFKPLQTGSTSTQSTGGVGSWLGPVISAGIGAATLGVNAANGGDGGGGNGSGFYAGANSGPMPTNSFMPQSNPAPYMGNPSSVGQYNPGNFAQPTSPNNAWLN